MNHLGTGELTLNDVLKKALESHSLLMVSLVECLSDGFEETYLFNRNQMSEEMVRGQYELYQSSLGEETDEMFDQWMRSKGYECQKMMKLKVQPQKGNLSQYEMVKE